ncbi:MULTISPECIES: hypothetical protein [Pectobacteriaceae]|uniref:hypothetical protein n=1 Tax=Pectobacteriaceae TaxID=1903410 RepID=UPI0015564050|nr:MULTISPECIES: hypothetical protein [Pectobacteriaceae]MEE3644381.1 hypothetical protein [Brenneria sp. L3_3C_1]MEE3651945.1 hypothetical protein [Brenneria sp. HEZEL_4_2_4]MEE3663709.1 hypothetical protein [Brenneria sp. g21c3]MBJ7223139.1 hypothetical protein [Brenneria sp. L3-3C-1]MDX5628649.1 hypothetical protein [Brenneria sp. L3-3Z]
MAVFFSFTTSAKAIEVIYSWEDRKALLSGNFVMKNQSLVLPARGVSVSLVEENFA